MLKKVYNFVLDNAISNEQIIYMTMKFFWKNLSVAIAAVSLLSACSDKSDLGPYTSAVPKPGVKQNIEEKTDYYSNIDWQTYAGDDFYRYATGAWQDATDPGDKDAVGTQHMQEIIMDEFLKKASNGGCPQLQRLITQYKGMEDYSADKQKVKAKLADIDDEVTSKEEAWKKMAQLLKEGYALPLDYTVGVEQRKTRALLLENEVVIQTKEDDMKEFATPEVRNAIWTGAARVWPKIAENDENENDGEDDEDNDDSDDKRSAKRRDCFMKPMIPVSLCMADTRAGGGADTPVGKIIRELGLNIEDVLIDPSNFKDLNQGLDDATVDDIKNLMKYCVISRDRNFVSGKDKASEIVRSLLEYSNSPTNLSVSRYYCETQVDPKSRMAVKEMGEIMRRTFMNRIERNAWLDAESKAGAKEKLKKMILMVGWPDRWNESAEATVKDDASMNTYDLICDLFKQRASKTIPAIKGKTDDDSFFLAELTQVPAWEANAFYATRNNEVLICASNLIPPIYDPTKDLIYNYALMGAPTLGHEMTHGFDGGGSEYDATGARREWMSPQCRATFKSLTARVVEHYDGWEYYPGLQCDGESTEKENTADMGGLCIAYEALMAQYQGSAAEKLYAAREFYRAFAYGWMEVGTPYYYLDYQRDFHAPGSLRVNGTVREMDEFYEAFSIRSGAMYLKPDVRLHIW